MGNSYPMFQKYLRNRITDFYADESKIFLVECLQKVSYLQGLPQNILIDIAYQMEIDSKEPGGRFFDADKEVSAMFLQEMIIVYSGVLYNYVVVDEKTELVLDYLTKGSILRSGHFLTSKKHSVHTGVLKNTYYYYLT